MGNCVCAVEEAKGMIRVGCEPRKLTRPTSRIKQGQRLITQHGFQMEIEHELRSVECSYLCHIWLYMYV